MEDLILIGGGGHCRSVIDSIKSTNKFNIVGILDIKDNIGKYVDEVEIIGCDEDINLIHKRGIKNAFITIGSIGNTYIRENLYKKIRFIGFNFPIIKDSSAIVSSNSFIGEGTFIGKGSIINSGTYIGKNCIINTGSILEHNCNIGDFVHISPGSVLSGDVKIGDKTHIGVNSTIIQGINIGKNCIIGGGSVVVKNIDENVKAYGNPCKGVK